jgi:hypothetical protein
MIVKFLISLWGRFAKTLEKDEYFVFWASLIFYFFLFFNLNNKTLIVFFALFVLLLIARLKDLKKALFWGFIASFPFIVGKTYIFNLIPATKLYTPDNPEGYKLVFVLTVSNLIAIFMFFLLIKELVFSKKRIFQLDFGFGCLFALIVLVFLSTIRSRDPGLSSLFFLQYLQAPLAFLYARYFINWQEKNRRILLFLLLAQVIYESIWVMLQFANKGPLGHSIEAYRGIVPFGSGPDEDVWRYRPTGTFFHANFVAAFLLPRIILNFSAFYEKKFRKHLSYFLTAFVLGLLALAITLSRSAWISLVLSLVILTFILEKKYHLSMLRVFKKRLYIIFIFMLVASPYLVWPRITSTFHTFVSGGSLVTRVELIKESLEIIEQNFSLGTGLGMSVPAMFENNPRGIMYYFPSPVHNWYLYFASEVGVFALLFFIFLLNFSLRRIFLKSNKDIFLAGLLVVCLSALINGILQSFLGGRELFFIFLGILAAV